MWIFQENLWVSLPESPRFEEQVWDVIISSQVAAEVESGPGPGHSGECAALVVCTASLEANGAYNDCWTILHKEPNIDLDRRIDGHYFSHCIH